MENLVRDSALSTDPLASITARCIIALLYARRNICIRRIVAAIVNNGVSLCRDEDIRRLGNNGAGRSVS